MKETNQKIEYMYGLLRYIENNISAELDTALLSGAGYVSYEKLYRDFYNLTGHSVKEYIRKRRLSNALGLIKTFDLGLTDIAFQCGYSSHQALCRAVRQALGMTPSEYRNGDTYFFFPPFDDGAFQSVTVLNDTIPRALCVMFYHSSFKGIENLSVNTFLQVFPDYSSRIFGRNGKRDGSKFCYELYLTDTERDYYRLKSSGFEIMREISGFTAVFAITTVQNNELQINAAWDYLYSQWLHSSMFEYTDEPYYEEYIGKNGKYNKLKLYLPIRKRSDETKISLIGNPGLRFIAAKAGGFNAEKIASKKVVDYLAVHYPYIIETINDLYVHKAVNACVCGIRVHPRLRLIENEDIGTIATLQNNYLLLESNVMGDYDRYADMLLSFARDHGMDVNKNGIFAVYDARGSFDSLKIKMYCPVNIRKK